MLFAPFDTLIDRGPWLRHQKVTPKPTFPDSPALARLSAKLEHAGWQQLDRRQTFGDVRPLVDRSGCRQRVCTCHDDSAWRWGTSYLHGCSVCGCDWRRERRHPGGAK